MTSIRFGVGFAQNWVDQKQHLDVVRIASGGDGMPAHVVAILLHAFDAIPNRDDRVSVPRRERPPDAACKSRVPAITRWLCPAQRTRRVFWGKIVSGGGMNR